MVEIAIVVEQLPRAAASHSEVRIFGGCELWLTSDGAGTRNRGPRTITTIPNSRKIIQIKDNDMKKRGNAVDEEPRLMRRANYPIIYF